MSYTWSESPLGVQILAVQDWLLENDHSKVLEEIEQRVQAGKAEFIVDLSKTTLINSMGLGLLIQLLTRSRSIDGEVIIAGISSKIRQILLVTRLQNTFIVKDSVEAALDFFEKTTSL